MKKNLDGRRIRKARALQEPPLTQDMLIALYAYAGEYRTVQKYVIPDRNRRSLYYGYRTGRLSSGAESAGRLALGRV